MYQPIWMIVLSLLIDKISKANMQIDYMVHLVHAYLQLQTMVQAKFLNQDDHNNKFKQSTVDTYMPKINWTFHNLSLLNSYFMDNL